nr:ribonuclease H-like domain-containing protein [Tanacetum cinerariifolium]
MSTRSSARNLFQPLDNPELTIPRRSRVDPTLLNDFEMATEGNGDPPVPDLRTMKELLGIKCLRHSHCQIQQYLKNEHYALWEVIEFGDSYEVLQEASGTGSASEGSAKKKGRTIAVTTEDMQKRRNDVKARTTLLLALPDEHQLRFSKYKTAQELWAAILKTSGGNEATKKTKKNQLQAIVSHLEFIDIEIEQDDLNKKFLTSLAPEWLMYTIVWRNRIDLDTMTKNNIGKEKVNTDSFPTASTQVFPASANVAAASSSHDTVCTYIASQSNSSQIKYKDINQIDEDDIEEIDIKWNMALLRSAGDPGAKTGSYMANEEEDHALVADQEASTEFVLMAKSSSNNEVEARLEFKNQEIKFCEKLRGIEFNVECKNDRIESLTNKLEELNKEKEGLDSKLTVLFPPPAQVYSPPKRDMSWTGLPEFADDTITDYSRTLPSIERNKGKATQVSNGLGRQRELILFLHVQGNSQNVIDDKGYWDSGCSWHMTGNISYHSDYEPYDGGYVSFGQGGGKITGKGIIKTGKLEFKNVYFMKDLKYNLFSVSQIRDNKNSVLFTDSECIVLGRDFKLKDDTNVLLRTPRQYNMYSTDLNNIIPHKDLTCLVAKASTDESILWHMRL